METAKAVRIGRALAEADLVIIGGDQIVAKPGENLDPGLSFAERLAEEYQVIYGCGNHEYRLKLYPEQNAEGRFRLRGHGLLYLYCNKHGLMKRKL